MTNCKSKKSILLDFTGKTGFEYVEAENEFEMELTDFHQNTFYCYTEVVPYSLLIGKPNNPSLPEKISVLSYCDDRVFKVGDILTITPTEKPARLKSMGLVYFMKDTIIDGTKKYEKIGTEHKALWGVPNIVE